MGCLLLPIVIESAAPMVIVKSESVKGVRVRVAVKGVSGVAALCEPMGEGALRGCSMLIALWDQMGRRD